MSAAAAPIRLFERVRMLLVRHEGFIHTEAFEELVNSVSAAFSALGAQVDVAINLPLIGEGINVVFGAHLIAAGTVLPANCILMNLEQFPDGIFARQPHYIELLRQHLVLDYSPRNAALITQMTGNAHTHVLRVGYMPVLTRITPAPVQDVDVLFYGSINERRKNIIDGLIAAGLNVKFLHGVYGQERDAWIARSKIVLNMHFYASKLHEVIRTSYLLANSKAVVSECDEDTEIEDDLRAAIVAVPYDQLVNTCRELVRDEIRRRAIEKSGFASFAARDQVAILARLLPQLSGALPRRINLGSGKAFDAESLNIDIDAKWNPDILGDISAPAGLRQIFFSRRFALTRLEPNSFDEITAMDLLEHVPDLVALMTRCIDLLAIGGAMRIGVPYDLSWGAWQDPTHIRAFNERSWLYYTEWHWYLGWLEARFTTTQLQMVFSPVGAAMRERGIADEEIFRTPRAVDSMQVVLVKHELSSEEKQNALLWFKGSA